MESGKKIRNIKPIYARFRVYQNMLRAAEMRNLSVVEQTVRLGKTVTKFDSDITEEDMIKITSDNASLIVIKLEDKPEKLRFFPRKIRGKKPPITYFVQLAEDRDRKSSIDPSAVLNKLKPLLKIPADENVEFLVVAKYKQNLTGSMIFDYEGTKYTCIEHQTFDTFICNIFEHISVVPHRILNPDERALILKSLGSSEEHISDLPVMRSYDPPVVWIGGRPEDIIEYDDISESAGTKKAWCVVI